MTKMIITSECEKCNHATIDESDKSWIKIYCAAKDKTYYCIIGDNAFHVII